MTLYSEGESAEECEIEITDEILTMTAHVKQSDGTIKDITSSFSKEGYPHYFAEEWSNVF